MSKKSIELIEKLQEQVQNLKQNLDSLNTGINDSDEVPHILKNIHIEENVRKSVWAVTPEYLHKGNGFIEVTEWTNGEGYDIHINDDKTFSMHMDEFEIIKKLVHKLESESC